MTRFTITPPKDFVLARDVCSYGYFLLAPNRWNPDDQSLTTTIDTGTRAVTLHITQPAADTRSRALTKLRGRTLLVSADATVPARERRQLEASLARMLNLQDDARAIAAFHRVSPKFKKLGRGRLFRSPTLFEDVIKTVTSCNVQWPSTIIMNARLCEVAGASSASGEKAFPTPQRLMRCSPAMLREQCRVGYRDARIVELSRMFSTGEINEASIMDPLTPDDLLRKTLLQWPGVGPYAAANILQLVGRYGHLPLDTEAVRHGRDVLGFKGTPAQIMKRVQKHFAPIGEHVFRAYWFEMWTMYEARRGPAWTWSPERKREAFSAKVQAAFAHERPPPARASSGSRRSLAAKARNSGQKIHSKS